MMPKNKRKAVPKNKRKAVPAQGLKIGMTICKTCGLSLTKSNRLRHMQIHAVDRKPIQCKVCFKTFARRDGLQRHHAIHILDGTMSPHASGQLPGKGVPVNTCGVCFETFGSAAFLESHRQLHTHKPAPIQNTVEFLNKLPAGYVLTIVNNIVALTYSELPAIRMEGDAYDSDNELVKFVPEVDEYQIYDELLDEHITSPLMSWEIAQKLIREDERWYMCENLKDTKKEMLFDRHIENIFANKQRENLWLAFESLPNLKVNCEWKKVKKQLKNVPGFVKHEKNHEWYDEFIADKKFEIKRKFKRLMYSCQLINSATYPKIITDQSAYEAIIDDLKDDDRYKAMDDNGMEAEREKMLQLHIRELFAKTLHQSTSKTD